MNLEKQIRLNWSSSTVIEWFKGIGNKKEYIFIKFDLREFYSSISESIFKKGILFTKKYHHISDEDVRITNQCQKSLLLNENEPWKKKTTEKLLRRDNGWLRRGINF